MDVAAVSQARYWAKGTSHEASPSVDEKLTRALELFDARYALISRVAALMNGAEIVSAVPVTISLPILKARRLLYWMNVSIVPR